MSAPTDLTIRTHERWEARLPIEFVVDDAHARQVRFTPDAEAVDAATIRGHTIDFSHGGVGLDTRTFVPRMCEGRLRVFEAEAAEVRPDGTEVRRLAFEWHVKVRRVVMRGREPKYFVGVAFADPDPVMESALVELMQRVGSQSTSQEE